jgi:hypothetical protein
MYTETESYKTRDFYLSAYLLALGNDLREHNRNSTGQTTFVFHNSEQLNQQVRKFYALEALINPVAYGNAFRNLKSILHATNTNTERKYVNNNRTEL